jgi:hypothetical protein
MTHRGRSNKLIWSSAENIRSDRIYVVQNNHGGQVFIARCLGMSISSDAKMWRESGRSVRKTCRSNAVADLLLCWISSQPFRNRTSPASEIVHRQPKFNSPGEIALQRRAGQITYRDRSIAYPHEVVFHDHCARRSPRRRRFAIRLCQPQASHIVCGLITCVDRGSAA